MPRREVGSRPPPAPGTPNAPHSLDYIPKLCTGFQEIHGDRFFAEDPAIVCGMAFLEGKPIMAVGQHKGRDVASGMTRCLDRQHAPAQRDPMDGKIERREDAHMRGQHPRKEARLGSQCAQRATADPRPVGDGKHNIRRE